MMCLLGTVVSWAGEATTIYERGTTTAWSSDDLADWTQLYCTATISDGLSVNTTDAGWTCTKGINATNGTVVTLTATIHTGGAPGRSGSYDYVQIGGVSLRFYEQDKVASVDVDGTSTNLTLTYNRASDYNVEITIDQFSGNVSYTCGTVSGTASSSTAISNIIFGHYRAGKENYAVTTILKNITVTEKEPEATSVNYTINYIFNSDTIKTVNAQNYVNTNIKAENPITINNVKYYIADGETTSMTLGSDATANVLNVNLRLAGTQTVNINAVDGENNILKTFSGTRTEGDAASNLYYTRAVQYNGKYYTVPASNGNSMNYGRSMAYGSDNVNITYSLDESIVYYSESENMLKSRSIATQTEGAVPDRASGGHWYRIYPNAHVYTPALSGGIYKVDLSARNEGSNESTLLVQLRKADGTLVDIEKSTSWANSANSVNTVEGIEVPEGYSIAIVNNTGYNSGAALDYVIVYKTGEQITIPDYEHGYASYVTTSALNFSGVKGLKAYIGVDEGEYKLKLREVKEVPAGTPIIVKGTRNTTYDIPVGTCTDEITDNLLQGSATDTHTVGANESIYALKVSDGKLHSVNAGVVVPAKKAYLVSGYGGSSSAKAITLEPVDDEEEATSVVAVAADEANGASKLYNAAGQQVGAGYNGIVIDQNGNKYVK
ncbi:MAG: hypothetical protein II844_02520 [Prevotella sp.]|nr:hypothetical protein [Prevotella sp.]